LDLVTSFVFHGDGVIVTQAPDILWLRDRDGDDVADERVVLFTGFGYADTHAVTSNLRWGLDGWIYGTQGYSGGNSRDVRSPYFDAHSGEPSRAFGHIPGGVFRFKADGSAMQPYSIYGSNTWGLDFSPAGDLFFTMANGSHLRQALLSEQELGANRIEGTKTWQDIVDHRQVQRLSKATRAPYVQIDYVGGFTAASGCTIYSGGVWPEEFAGNHFVCEPTVNLVHRDVLSVDGATHRASKPRQAEFLASTDPWFRPVQTRVGPAGDLFVVDFYNQAAVHNDTRGPSHGPTNAAVRPDRDAMHGRIWRVQHREALTEPALGAHFWNGMRDLRGLREGVLPESAAPSLFDSSKEVRVRALWFAFHSERLEVSTLQAGLIDTEPMVRRAAARIAGEVSGESGYESLGTSLASLVHDSDPGVQLAALATLVHFNLGDAQVTGLIADYDQLQNDWVRSAFLRLAEQHSTRFLEAFFKRANSSSDIESVDLLLRLVAIRAQAGSPAEVLRLLELLQGASKPLTRFLPRIVETLQTDLAPQFTFGSANERAGVVLASLFEAYQENSQASRALLPLAARIQNSPPLERSIAGAAKELLSAAMSEQEDLQVRQDALLTLLEIPAWRASAIEASEAFLGPHYAPGPQQQLIKALGKTRNEGAAKQLARAFPRVTNASRDAIFKELIARPEWTGFLLDEIVDEEIRVGDLGPRRLFRLREHSDKATAKRAKFVLDQYSAPAPAMEELIESLLPVILQAGDLQKGRELFIQNCAVCHRYDGLPEGLGADVGPSLVGMGAHGAEHLLPFILDPNLSVEAAFLEYVAETTDGQMLTGVLTYDGPDSITLASSAGTESIRRSSLVDLYSTGRSPMPTGFESLGAEALRDLLAFLCEGYGDYRIVNLESQFNSSTSLGLYDQRYDVHSMRFHSFGVVQVAGTPMEIFDPGLMPEGNNAVVLKGGARDDWQSKMDMPQRIEVPIGFALQRMHVLGGISAWGHPFFGDEDPAVSWTFHYADGSSEEHVLRDGVEFADWIRRHDVPGSEYVEGLLHDNSVGQLRSFSVDPGKPELVIDSLTLESFDNRTAPTFLALTAQLLGAGPKIAAPAVILTYPRLMILGGGSSHDFPRWFDQELRSTLAQGTHFEVSEIEYTSRPMDLLPRLPELEVLVLSNNKAMDHAGLRQGIFDHVAAGGGLLLVHAALWYNWADWPEYNQKLVGGGSRSHEAYGTFDVQLVKEHPVLEGLPTEFTVEDELYRFEADSSGTAIEVLARGTSKVTGNSYPVVWITQTPAGRVLCVSLGHDGAVHEHPAFQRLIQNAAGWLDPETD
jgi:putative membrane-bound dehydrogenase-like protein